MARVFRLLNHCSPIFLAYYALSMGVCCSAFQDNVVASSLT